MNRSETDDLTAAESGLKEILMEHRGRRDAITSEELAERVGLETSNGNPEARFGIRSLIKKTGLPIAACPEGYFVITTRRELHDYLSALDGRIAGIESRKTMVEEAFESETAQQTLEEVKNE